MDGILLSNKEKQLKEFMFKVLNSERVDYRSFKKAIKTKTMMATKQPEDHILSVIEAVGIVVDVCPTNKIRNIDRFCAGAAEVLCDKNNLSSFGARIVLDEQVHESKYLPTISEFDKAAQVFAQTLYELDTSRKHKRFMDYEKLLFNRLKEAGIELAGTHKWHYVFPYDEFMGLGFGQTNDDGFYNTIIEKLSLPKPKNVSLYLLETTKAFYDSVNRAFDGKMPDIDNFSKDSIISEIKKQFHNVDDLGIGVDFLTPSQWQVFNWNNVKLSNANCDKPFSPFSPTFFRLMDLDCFEPSILEHLKILTKQYFEMEEMFA